MDDDTFRDALKRIRASAASLGYSADLRKHMRRKLQLSEENFFLVWHSAKILDTPIDLSDNWKPHARRAQTRIKRRLAGEKGHK